MHKIIFTIEQRQDFYLSLAFTRLIKNRILENHEGIQIMALFLSECERAEYRPYLDEFDQVAYVGHFCFPESIKTVYPTLKQIMRLQREVRHLNLCSQDVLVAYSFREFVMNVLIKALRPKPRLVRIRKCDQNSEAFYTHRRPLLSLYLNTWNFFFGTSLMRYRWLPNSKRVGGVPSYIRDPYEFEFCLNPIDSVKSNSDQIPYPFAVLRNLPIEKSPSAQPTIVILGELYPFEDTMDVKLFISDFNWILNYIRQSFPMHRLIFKPRTSVDGLGLDLKNFEIAYQDILLEALLLKDPGIEKVISFKSSGSFVATTFGIDGYLLYPLIKLSIVYKKVLDAYFEQHQTSTCFVYELEDLNKTQKMDCKKSIDMIERLCQPLLNVLLKDIE